MNFIPTRKNRLVADVRVQEYRGDGQQGGADPHWTVAQPGPVWQQGQGVGGALQQE